MTWLEDKARNRYSQFGEDGILEAIFSVIGTANKWCFECGATDGIFFSNTRRLIEQGWNAALVEVDYKAFERLTANNEAFGDRVKCVHGKAETLDGVLSDCGAPADLDLCVIDVDGQDYHLFNSMLRFRPRVVMIEFDPNAEPHFIPPVGGAGQAGLGATRRLAEGRFYTPVHQTWCNLICVAQPFDRLLSGETLS